ncbi:MAG: HNH endonuclease [Anaerolineales bacterium]|nr:HNH endonuclease [Anaerolineales bacterium]
MFNIGDIISYLEMCAAEGVNLQRGMNFRLGKAYSVVLMSVRPNAPYSDRIENDGKVLIYEGHDISNRKGGVDPKTVDQSLKSPNGTPTQNGLFFKSVEQYAKNGELPEIVKVYEKIRSGIWTYNGLFQLVDAWFEEADRRKVCKFRLELLEGQNAPIIESAQLDHARIIPASVKRQVWKRDKGQCVECGSKDNLHFDHIIPYAKGGSSLVAENIQLLCARHNLKKRDKIQ